MVPLLENFENFLVLPLFKTKPSVKIIGGRLAPLLAPPQCLPLLVPPNSLNGSFGKILIPDLNLTRLFWHTVFLKMVTLLVSVNSFLHETILTITIFKIIVQTSLNSKTQNEIFQKKF